MALLATVLSVACTDNHATMEENPRITFHITLSTGESRTAANIGSTADIGADKDYYINPYDVEVLLYDTDGNFVRRAVIGAVIPTQTPGVYDLTGSIEDITEGTYQMVALCNQRGNLTTNYTVSGIPATLEGLISLVTYNYNTSFTGLTTDGGFRIPMWGITPATLEDGATITVDVLRAMAKVKVSCTADNATLTSVSMTRVNNKGYLAAQDGQAVTAGGTTNYNSPQGIGIDNPSIPTDSVQSTDVAFVKQTDGSFILYIPEFEQTGNNSTDAYMQLGFTDKDGNTLSPTSPYLFFAEYPTDTNGKTANPTQNEWDIIRNDFYEYEVTAVSAGKLEANVRVLPWDYEQMNYELSQEATLYIDWAQSMPTIYDKELNLTAMPTCYETDWKQAWFLVRLTEPQGVKWTAHLTNPVDFELVETEECKRYGYGNGNDEANQPQTKVMVRPKNPYKAGTVRKTDLYFTIETLVDDSKAKLTWWESNGDFVLTETQNKLIRIVQTDGSDWVNRSEISN